jgi:hypothetical protein
VLAATCRVCGATVDLVPRIAPDALTGWSFTTDRGWRCPEHVHV